MHREGHTATRSSSAGPATEELAALSDEELVSRAQQDPSQAEACLGLIFERYGRKVTNWCGRICRDPDLAEDAAQEVFVKLHRRLDSFEGGSRFTTWLFVLARNSTLDFLAKRRHQRTGEPIEDLIHEPAGSEPAMESALAERDLRDRLRRAVQTELAPDEARVVVLHCMHGLTLPAVTEIMGLQNRSGAKALFVAAKRKLKSRFAKELNELSRP